MEGGRESPEKAAVCRGCQYGRTEDGGLERPPVSEMLAVQIPSTQVKPGRALQTWHSGWGVVAEMSRSWELSDSKLQVQQEALPQDKKVVARYGSTCL